MSASAHPSKSWWSLPQKSLPPTIQPDMSFIPEKSSRTHKSSLPLSFNSLASAIGFKSKKHLPSLAIQTPPPNPVHPSSPGQHRTRTFSSAYSSRPPSKSVSSTRSRVDSLEPRTPSDVPRDHRQSLLTLSDVDPFAGRGVITVSSPHSPSDPNRLSAYSNRSAGDIQPKKPELPLFNRVSYASSSSYSQNHGGDLSPLSPPTSPSLLPDTFLPKKLKNKKSGSSLHKKRSFLSGDSINKQSGAPALDCPPESSRSDEKISNNEELSPPPRPPMRARGVTDPATGKRPAILREDRPVVPVASFLKLSSPERVSPSPPAVSPRVIIRQASIQRIGSPPSAPPKQRLPAPPVFPPERPGLPSASSSSLSFASCKDFVPGGSFNTLLPENSSFSSSTIDHERQLPHAVKSFQSTPSSPRALKKVLSQSSLTRKGSQASTSATSPPSDKAAEAEKAPRKQRSFHHPRMPIPPIPMPLRHASSFGTPSSSPPSDSVISEQRRGSTSSSTAPSRKRLFSGSSLRRPSTSQCTPADEDAQSIFSLRSNPDNPTASTFIPKPWALKQSSSSPSSFWDEGGADTTPNSPIHSLHEYTPQHIMSPAEMAKVEASMGNTGLSARGRGLSMMSVTSMSSELEVEYSGVALPPSSWSGGRYTSRSRTNSLLVKSTASVKIGGRPSTAQADLTPTLEPPTFRPSSSPPPTMTSLPPPPRPRQRPIPESERTSVVVTSLPPPPRKSRPKKTSIEKVILHQSIMRKPSFLDIDDETGDDTDIDPVEDQGGGSFLDLAKESFDTTRSD